MNDTAAPLQCLCCGHQGLRAEATLTSLYLSRKAWGGAPEPTDLLYCAACGFRTYRRELSHDEAMRYYADYGSEAYIAGRGRDELFYTRRLHEANEAWQDSAPRQAAVLEALAPHASGLSAMSVLDYGGSDGRLVRSLPCARRAVFDFADTPAVDGVERLASEGELGHGDWDIVLCAQTLEHISQPQRFLTGLVALLRTGGLLYLELPDQQWTSRAGSGRVRDTLLAVAQRSRLMHQALDLYSTAFRVRIGSVPPLGFVPMREHVNFFTVDAVSQMARRGGWQVLAAQVHRIGVIQAVLCKP